MLDYTSFSALRLKQLFATELLESYPFYTEIDPEGDFDTEYLGGQWSEETIDGVRFWYPEVAGKKVGIIELWGSLPVAGGCPVRDHPNSLADWLVPTWVVNADRVLDALTLPIRFGSGEADVRVLAAGRILSSKFPSEWFKLVNRPDETGSLSTLHFACRAPDLYHIKAIVHATAGLLKIEMISPDVVRANDRTGVYDGCFAGLYDAGQE